MQVLVGRIGRPHGVKGGVTVDVRTDDPKSRFAAGSVLATDPASAGPLTVAGSGRSGQIQIVFFEGFLDREAAESLRGVLLVMEGEELTPPDDPDEFYDHQLIGLAAVHIDGRALGEIADVLHPPAAPVLVIRGELSPEKAGDDVLVPFVSAIVPTVDLEGRHCVIDPPDGMFADAPVQP
ncbi:MAG: ribosome maturation factor RimM [Nakamurella sp.]